MARRSRDLWLNTNENDNQYGYRGQAEPRGTALVPRWATGYALSRRCRMAQDAGPDESARADEAYGRRWHYLQLIPGYSAVKTGLAFLPMIAALTASST